MKVKKLKCYIIALQIRYCFSFLLLCNKFSRFKQHPFMRLQFCMSEVRPGLGFLLTDIKSLLPKVCWRFWGNIYFQTQFY